MKAMNITDQIKSVIARQQAFYATGQSQKVDNRIEKLKKLKRNIRRHEEALLEALWIDLHKSKFEAYATEIGLVMDELGQHIKKVSKWSAPRKEITPVAHYKSDSYIYPEPYGTCLIIAPWNYPFQLLFNPLIGAISAGNTAVVKPSPYTPQTAKVMETIIQDTFEEEYVAVFQGGREVNSALLDEAWDYIFFTGSPALGKIVMEKAARHLTPITLELGGKSPCIVDEDAHIDLAARRLVWGKLINAGQTCIAPDFLMVHRSVKEPLISRMKHYIIQFYGDNAQESPDYPRIVNEANVIRLQKLMEDGNIIFGGTCDAADRYVSPTLLDAVDPESPLMQEEIFGPLLPILEFGHIDEAIGFINKRPKPLAFYYFSENSQKHDYVLQRTTSGGGCINDTLMHIANHNLPFGGVGNSGMGRYHGKYSFETFSNLRAILKKSTLLDVPVRYAPFKDKLGMIKMLLN